MSEQNGLCVIYTVCYIERDKDKKNGKLEVQCIQYMQF